MISRRKYSQEFKRKLVIELLTKASSKAKICQREKIAPQTLEKWRVLFEENHMDNENKENINLKKENNELKEIIADLVLENKVLKKTEKLILQMRKKEK